MFCEHLFYAIMVGTIPGGDSSHFFDVQHGSQQASILVGNIRMMSREDGFQWECLFDGLFLGDGSHLLNIWGQFSLFRYIN